MFIMFLKKFFLLFLIISSVTIFHRNCVSADLTDPIDEDEDVEVEMDDLPTDSAVVGRDGIEEEEELDESEEKPLRPSPDADTTFLFTQPAGVGLELPAGKDVHFLVGFANRGVKDFIIESMDASFRYPLDFSFHIQNFSTISYNRLVKPKQEVSFYYAFYTSDTFSSRPFGLIVNLLYKDANGNQYLDAVFNETVTIVEIEESLDGETFFLYVFLAACAVLLIVATQQFLVSFARRKISSGQKIEMGTQNHQDDVDYDWLPKETLNELNKSPRKSPRKSPKQAQNKSNHMSPKQSPPRQRRAKRGTGAKDE